MWYMTLDELVRAQTEYPSAEALVLETVNAIRVSESCPCCEGGTYCPPDRKGIRCPVCKSQAPFTTFSHYEFIGDKDATSK